VDQPVPGRPSDFENLGHQRFAPDEPGQGFELRRLHREVHRRRHAHAEKGGQQRPASQNESGDRMPRGHWLRVLKGHAGSEARGAHPPMARSLWLLRIAPRQAGKRAGPRQGPWGYGFFVSRATASRNRRCAAGAWKVLTQPAASVAALSSMRASTGRRKEAFTWAKARAGSSASR